MAYTRFPISPVGAVDPMMPSDNPLTPAMIREFPAMRTFRYFDADTCVDAAYPAVPADPTVSIAYRYLVYKDEGRTDAPFNSYMIRIANDAAAPNNLAYSFDGVTDAGIVAPGQIEDIKRVEGAIYIRKTGADVPYRIWAY